MNEKYKQGFRKLNALCQITQRLLSKVRLTLKSVLLHNPRFACSTVGKGDDVPLWQRSTSCTQRKPWNIFTWKKKKACSCYLAVGGWKAPKQFSEHDNCVSCFNSIKMAEQNMAKLSEGEKKVTFRLRTSLINSNPKGELKMLQVPQPLTSNKNNSAMITSAKLGLFYKQSSLKGQIGRKKN